MSRGNASRIWGRYRRPCPLGPELRQPASKLNLHSSVEGAISARERRTSVANRNHKLDPLSNGCDVLDARSQWRFQGGMGWERGVEQGVGRSLLFGRPCK
jgi:hypothetical protein